MALTTTSLATAFSATAETFNATAATGATVGGFAKIDGELMIITGITGTAITVRSRGLNGGTAVAHVSLSSVVFGLLSDLAGLGKTEIVPVPAAFDMATISVDGYAIPAPVRNTVYFITQAAALSSCTLANPLASQDGLMVSFVGCTDWPHVVTGVSIQDGITGGSKTTLTSASFKGATITLIAWGTNWMVVKNQLWVIT